MPQTALLRSELSPGLKYVRGKRVEGPGVVLGEAGFVQNRSSPC